MMKLALMTAFFESVDQDWRSPIADEIASRWISGSATVRAARASANFVFRVEAAGRQYFLRFNHESERQVEAVVAELGFIDHLAHRGIEVARPVAARSGLLVETVATDQGRFHAVLLEALSGRHVTLEELDAAGLVRWGGALGELHSASQGYSTSHRPSWSDHIQWARCEIPAAEERLLEELRAVEERLDELTAGPEDFGLIHYDFELDNLLWQDDGIGVVDLDDCAYYWFAADIAYALRDLFDDCAEGVDLSDQRLRAFLEGYRSVRPITDEQLRCIPLFMRLHGIIAFAKLSRALDGGQAADEPAWAVDLRRKLAGTMAALRQSVAEHPLRELGQ